MLKGKQDYQDIEREYNVKYKEVFGNSNYLFCEDVEDQYKVWSKYNQYFLSPNYVNNHLRFTIRMNKWNKTKFFYHLVWEEKNQKEFPKGMVCHHVDLNPRHDNYFNLLVLTKKNHKLLHIEIDKLLRALGLTEIDL